MTTVLQATSTAANSNQRGHDHHVGSMMMTAAATTQNYPFSSMVSPPGNANDIVFASNSGLINNNNTCYHHHHRQQQQKQPSEIRTASIQSNTSSSALPSIFSAEFIGDLIGLSAENPTEDTLSNILFEAGKILDGMDDNNCSAANGYDNCGITITRSNNNNNMKTSSAVSNSTMINFHQISSQQQQSSPPMMMMPDLEPTPIAPFGVTTSILTTPGCSNYNNHHQPMMTTMIMNNNKNNNSYNNLQSLEALRNLIAAQGCGGTTRTINKPQQQSLHQLEHTMISSPHSNGRNDDRIISNNFRLRDAADDRHRTLDVPLSLSASLAAGAAAVSDGDSLSTMSSSDDNDNNMKDRFRCYQNCQWESKFNDLVNYHKKNGHCLVPHNYHDQGLAQWVKRQRYQMKLLVQDKHSTINKERKAKLEGLGFIFDSHRATWEEKFQALLLFKAQNGHCNVPSKYEDKSLAIWVKCQRRQMKLRQLSQQSAMTRDRIDRLTSVGFVFNPRNL